LGLTAFVIIFAPHDDYKTYKANMQDALEKGRCLIVLCSK